MSYKILTLNERLNNKEHLIKIPARRIEQYILQTSKTLDEPTQTVVNTLSYVLKTKTSLKKYKTSDFKLENLIESGAIDQLKPTFNNRDNFTTIGNIKEQLSNLEQSQLNNN